MTGQGACIPGRWQELIEWLKRVVHPAIKTSPGALAAHVMRAQSAVHVDTKIDCEQSSARPVAARHSCRPVKFVTSSPCSHQPPLEETNPVVPTTVAVTPCGLVPVYQTARCYSRQYARHHQCNFFSEFANVRACLFVVKTRIPRSVSHIMCATSCSVFECHRLTDTQSYRLSPNRSSACLFSLFCANSVCISHRSCACYKYCPAFLSPVILYFS